MMDLLVYMKLHEIAAHVRTMLCVSADIHASIYMRCVFYLEKNIDFDSCKRCYKAMAKSKATAKKLRKTKK